MGVWGLGETNWRVGTLSLGPASEGVAAGEGLRRCTASLLLRDPTKRIVVHSPGFTPSDRGKTVYVKRRVHCRLPCLVARGPSYPLSRDPLCSAWRIRPHSPRENNDSLLLGFQTQNLNSCHT